MHLTMLCITVGWISTQVRFRWRYLVGVIHYCFHALSICVLVVLLEIFVEMSKSWGIKRVKVWPALIGNTDKLFFFGVPVTRVVFEQLISISDLLLFLQRAQTAMCCSPREQAFQQAHPMLGHSAAPTFEFEYDCGRRSVEAAGGEGEFQLGRWTFVFYKVLISVYYYVLSTPVASTVMGVYLAIGFLCFNIHMNDSFVALREENFKSFARVKIEWYIKLFLGVHFADNLA
jgi:hypothetical protein